MKYLHTIKEGRFKTWHVFTDGDKTITLKEGSADGIKVYSYEGVFINKNTGNITVSIKRGVSLDTIHKAVELAGLYKDVLAKGIKPTVAKGNNYEKFTYGGDSLVTNHC